LTTRHLSLALIACGCAMLIPLAARADAASEYVVQAGDTPWSIAGRLRVGVRDLLSANHLGAHSTIRPGQRLIVPGPEDAAPPAHPASGAYIVRPGDTLSGIAAHLGVGLDALASANHLALTTPIRPGEALAVPGPATPAHAVPAPPDAALPEHPGRAATARPAPAGPTPPAPIVETRILSTPVRTALPSRGAAFTSAVVRTALRYLGRPYRWAGVGNTGFDCSGLVESVFAAVGLRLPHSSYGQFQAGIAVPRWALAAGDLVFFHTYGSGASHVGIYLGANRFIHAESRRGVTVSSMLEPYYSVRYLGARRI
jgi:peptidoglycan endopeptidase LytE